MSGNFLFGWMFPLASRLPCHPSKPTPLEDVHTVKRHARLSAVYVGSGVDESTVGGLLEDRRHSIQTAVPRFQRPLTPRAFALVSIVRRKFTVERLASH